MLHFLLDDLKLDILFAFFQFIKPLLGGGIDNPHLNSVEHIGDAALGFFQLLAEGREYAAFPALNVHHGIRHILHKIIVHDFCHDRIDNGVFQRQLSDGLVLGVTGTVFLGIHTAVIMILPALAGTCPAFAYHHSPASAAKQLCCQKIIVLGFVPCRGFPVYCKPLLYPVKQVLRDNGGNPIGRDDMAVAVLSDVLPVFQ